MAKKKMDRLSRDATEALKVGMSYGKWKALHPHTAEEEIEVPDQRKLVDKFCEICGAQLDKATKRYCSPEHSYEAKKARCREYIQRKRERMMADGKI